MAVAGSSARASEFERALGGRVCGGSRIFDIETLLYHGYSKVMCRGVPFGFKRPFKEGDWKRLEENGETLCSTCVCDFPA